MSAVTDGGQGVRSLRLLSLLAAQAVKDPTGDDCLRHSCDERFGLVLGIRLASVLAFTIRQDGNRTKRRQSFRLGRRVPAADVGDQLVGFGGPHDPGLVLEHRAGSVDDADRRSPMPLRRRPGARTASRRPHRVAEQTLVVVHAPSCPAPAARRPTVRPDRPAMPSPGRLARAPSAIATCGPRRKRT